MSEKPTTDPSAVRAFITETFLFGDDSGLENDASFMETGLIDSLGVLQIADFIKKTYGIQIKEDQFIPENLDSIERITRFVDRSLTSSK